MSEVVLRARPMTAYAIAVAVVAFDQIVKWWVLSAAFPAACPGFTAHPAGALGACSIPVMPVFNLTMVWNVGVSFGLLNGEMSWVRWALAAFSLAVAAFLAIWARRTTRPLLAVAIGLVMGGAVGNVIDRVRFGAVADFLDFHALHFPWVFNVADSAISIGVVLLLLDSFRSERRPQDRPV